MFRLEFFRVRFSFEKLEILNLVCFSFFVGFCIELRFFFLGVESIIVYEEILR